MPASYLIVPVDDGARGLCLFVVERPVLLVISEANLYPSGACGLRQINCCAD